MAQDGSSLAQVKNAYITLLQARLSNVLYQSPMKAEDITGQDGSWNVVGWDDNGKASAEVKVFKGTPLSIDETYTLTLVIQAIGTSIDDTQYLCDKRAVAMLGEALGVIANDPSLGLAINADFQTFHALPAGWSYESGVFPANFRAARFDLDIEVKARLTLE